MSPLKVFKSTCSLPTQLLNTSLRHFFSQETIEFQCLAASSVWRGNTGSGSEKHREESRVMEVAYERKMVACWSLMYRES